MCFCEHWPECGTTGCSVLWQGDSGSKTGPLLLATPPGRSTSTHCSSSSACWLTGRPMGAWDWLAFPQASGTKSIRETRLKTKDKNLHFVAQKIRIVQFNSHLGLKFIERGKRREHVGMGSKATASFCWHPDPPYLCPLHMNHTCSCINSHTCLSSTIWIMCPLCMSFCRRTHRVENKVLCGCPMWY